MPRRLAFLAGDFEAARRPDRRHRLLDRHAAAVEPHLDIAQTPARLRIVDQQAAQQLAQTRRHALLADQRVERAALDLVLDDLFFRLPGARQLAEQQMQDQHAQRVEILRRRPGSAGVGLGERALDRLVDDRLIQARRRGHAVAEHGDPPVGVAKEDIARPDAAMGQKLAVEIEQGLHDRGDDMGDQRFLAPGRDGIVGRPGQPFAQRLFADDGEHAPIGRRPVDGTDLDRRQHAVAFQQLQLADRLHARRHLRVADHREMAAAGCFDVFGDESGSRGRAQAGQWLVVMDVETILQPHRRPRRCRHTGVRLRLDRHPRLSLSKDTADAALGYDHTGFDDERAIMSTVPAKFILDLRRHPLAHPNRREACSEVP